jgi:hypothetical protein
MVAAYSVEHDHIKGCRCRALFVKASDVEAFRFRASVDKLVDGSLITVKGKHHRFIFCEELHKGGFIETVGMQIRRVELGQVDNVDHAYLQFRDMLT